MAHGKWQLAGLLKSGDSLVDADGNIKKVISVKQELLLESEKIYNLSIEDYHTYYVSDLSVLVHNVGCVSTKELIEKAIGSKLVGYTFKEMDEFRGVLKKSRNYTRTMFRELMKGIDEGFYTMEKVALHGKDVYKIEVLALDAAGKPIPKEISMTVWVDNYGKVLMERHRIIGKTLVDRSKVTGYLNAITKPYERGHLFSFQEGLLDNCVGDSPLNIIAQEKYVNSPRIRAFEEYRAEKFAGKDVINEILGDGYVNVKVVEPSDISKVYVDVTYNPLSRISEERWPKDWFDPDNYFGKTWD